VPWNLPGGTDENHEHGHCSRSPGEELNLRHEHKGLLPTLQWCLVLQIQCDTPILVCSDVPGRSVVPVFASHCQHCVMTIGCVVKLSCRL
jgi:hypothetical protein